jgi:hypothetical protein
MRSVIFLDCDGVINCVSPSYTTSYYRPDGSVTYFDEHLVQRLNWLIKKTDADVVISSSWRYDMEDLQRQMELNGFEFQGRVIGYTPTLTHRGEEIQAWLDEHHDVKCFVVLEDEVQDVCGEKCNIISKLDVIEVNPEVGLTHQNVVNAYHILTACERREELND